MMITKFLILFRIEELPIQFLSLFSVNTQRYVSYRHSKIPRVLRGPGIIYMPKTERIKFGCYQEDLVNLQVSQCS